MKHLLWLLIAAGMTFGASSALAQKSPGKDAMGAEVVRHDSMNKESRNRDAMHGDAMGKEAITENTMAADPTENGFILRRSIREAGMDKE